MTTPTTQDELRDKVDAWFEEYGKKPSPAARGLAVSGIMQLITTHYTPKTEQQESGFVDKHGTTLSVGDKVYITNPCGQCQSEDSKYGNNPWGKGCAYKWNREWKLCFGFHEVRNEFTTLSHNGKTSHIGYYFSRTDIGGDNHFLVTSPWITQTYGEKI